MKVEIEVQVTKQVRQYEPLTVRIKTEGDVNRTEDYTSLRDQVTAMVQDTLATNLEVYKK